MNNIYRTMAGSTSAAFLGCFLIVSGAEAKQTHFVVDDPMGRDIVSFTSNAPIELIQGRTNKVSGIVTLDDSLNFSRKPFNAKFAVDLTSIDTGIKMRNEHMRDNFLETPKFPTALLEVTGVKGSPTILKDGKTISLSATGQFTIHGVKVKRKIPVSVTYFAPCDKAQQKSRACDAIVIKASFPVKLETHKIKRPEMLFQKLADTVFVTVSVTARRKPASAG